MPHFFIKSEDINDKKIIINDADNYRHIAKSLRARVGEELLLIDENSVQYETVILNINDKNIEVKINKSYKSHRKLDFGLYLAQSPLRSDAQNTIIEKATELGAAEVIPVYTDNCALNKEVIIKKIPKWQKIMFEASKQCERANIPVCAELSAIKDLVEAGNFTHIIAFCERFATNTYRDYIKENPNVYNSNSKLLVIIGPEGGFSQKEFDYFREKSIPMLTLGDLILKAETAVIMALGNIIYEYNCNRQN